MEAAVHARKLPQATPATVDTQAPTMKPSPTHASLLGLPPEIRFLIYDLVADFDICHPAFDHAIHIAKVLRCLTFMLPQPRRFTAIRLPIANLATTCTLLATEIRRHSRSLPASQRFAVVRVTSSLENNTADLLHFHRAPCRIDDLTAVKIVLDLKVGKFDIDLDDPLRRPASQTPPILQYCAQHTRTQLMYLLHPASTFGAASAMKSVQIYIHVERLPSNELSKKTYETLVQYIRNAYTQELSPDCLSSTVVRERKLSMPGFSSDVWVERAGEVALNHPHQTIKTPHITGSFLGQHLLQSTQMSMSTSRTSLLGLPPELRLYIHDIVASTEISRPAFYLEHTHDTAGRRTKRLRRALSLQLPVANLAMSCSFIADEIRKHIHALPASHRFAELRTTASSHFNSGQLFLQRAPCHIGDLTILEVIVDLEIGNYEYFDGTVSTSALVLEADVQNSSYQLALLLWNLIHPSGFIGRDTRALTEVHVQLNIARGTRNIQSKQNYDQLVQEVRKAYETMFVADLFSTEGWDTAPILRMKEITSEPWVDRPG